MSIQWSFVAGYLYLEIGIVIILMLPIASPRRWNKFFKSRLFSKFQDKAIYFYMWLGILGLFFVDAFREMRKYSHPAESSSGNINLANDMKNSIKLFRAQRNFYITSFAIFLAFVIRRLITMIIIQAEMLEKSAQIVNEAEKAKDLAKTTLLAHTIRSAGDSSESELQAQLKSLEYLLSEEKNKTKLLEQQLNKWKSKYEEICDLKSDK